MEGKDCRSHAASPAVMLLESTSESDRERTCLMQEFAAKGSFIQYGGVVDHALVVRGITTVFNTDYMTDFVFHLNGEIQVF